LIFDYYIAIAPIYILRQIEFEAKGYGLKHSIGNLMNQPSCTLDATTVLDYISKGRALLLLVCKTNLKPSSWRIYTLRIVENILEMRKLWPFKVKGVKNSKRKLLNTTKAGS